MYFFNFTILVKNRIQLLLVLLAFIFFTLFYFNFLNIQVVQAQSFQKIQPLIEEKEFAQPIQMLVNSKTHNLYILNKDSRSLAVADKGGSKIKYLIPLGYEPQDIAFDPDLDKIFILSRQSKNVTILDAKLIEQGKMDQLFAKIINFPERSDPWQIRLNKKTHAVYVMSRGEGNLYIINADGDFGAERIFAEVKVGGVPSSLDFNSNTGKVYAASQTSNTVSVINDQHKVITDIFIGGSPFFLRVNPETNKIYIADIENNKVSVIDGRTDKVISSIETGLQPIWISINSFTNKIYVYNFLDSAISVIDGATDKILTQISLPIGVFIREPGIDLVQNKIYLFNEASGDVLIIDGASNKILNNISLGAFSSLTAINSIRSEVSGVALDSDLKRAYLVNPEDNSLTIIDTSNYSVFYLGSKPIQAEKDFLRGPAGLTIGTIRNRVYVLNYLSGNLTIINGETDNLEKTVYVGNKPSAIRLGDKKIYVTLPAENEVAVISPEGEILSRIKVKPNPTNIFPVPKLNKTYILHYFGGVITVLDGRTYAIIKEISVGKLPKSFAFNSVLDEIYVVEQETNSLLVIDALEDKITDKLETGQQPTGVAFEAQLNKIYVANFSDGTLSVFNSETKKSLGFIEVGSGPADAIANLGKIYVRNVLSNSVSVIDSFTDKKIKDISVGSRPLGMVLNKETNKIYILNKWSPFISVIDTINDSLLPNINLGGLIRYFNINFRTGKIYATSPLDNSVIVVDSNQDKNNWLITALILILIGVLWFWRKKYRSHSAPSLRH